jgi:NADPH:quinone reductase-like Zn-dependent oxidoreductase
MMALRAHVPGGSEVLVYESAPRPTPGNGEVLIAVHAAAITFDELTWPETWVSEGVDRTPVIPSHEFSGLVAEVGDGVTGLSAGDEVYGLVPFDRQGAAAEYVSVPATSVAARPCTVSHVVAAAAVLPALTAWEALVDHAAVQRGQRVLVTEAPAVSAPSSPSWRRPWVRASRARRTPPMWHTSSPWAPSA